MLAFECKINKKLLSEKQAVRTLSGAPLPGERGLWSLNITVPQGGLLPQELSDKYSNYPPSNGYKDSLLIESQATDPRPDRSKNYLRAYFSVPQSNVYGSFTLQPYAYWQGEPSCHLDGDIKYTQQGRDLSRNTCLNC